MSKKKSHPKDDKYSIIKNKERIEELFGERTIAYRVEFAHIFKSTKAALLLSQLFYWCDKGKDPLGWVYKTTNEFTEETGLSRKEQETARCILKSANIIEEKYGSIPRRLFYKVNLPNLEKLLIKYYDSSEKEKITELEDDLE